MPVREWWFDTSLQISAKSHWDGRSLKIMAVHYSCGNLHDHQNAARCVDFTSYIKDSQGPQLSDLFYYPYMRRCKDDRLLLISSRRSRATARSKSTRKRRENNSAWGKSAVSSDSNSISKRRSLSRLHRVPACRIRLAHLDSTYNAVCLKCRGVFHHLNNIKYLFPLLEL